MVEEEAEVASLLAGSAVEGRPIDRLRLPDGEPDAFVISCEPHEVREVWSAGRSIVGETGHWPVVTAAWSDSIQSEVSNRFPFHHGSPGAATTIGEIMRRARTVDAGAVLAELAAKQDGHDAYASLPDFELPYTHSAVGDAPDEAEIQASLGSHATHAELDRWLLEWELERGFTETDVESGYLSWYEPEGQETGLVLLPTSNSWETLAYLSFFGAEGPGGAERLIAVLRRWHDDFGAELVAHFGIMLQFAVHRPPTTLETAWELAREQELVAECTTILPGIPLRHHARALVGRDSWFLFERP